MNSVLVLKDKKTSISTKEFIILIIISVLIFVTIIGISQNKIGTFSFFYKDYSSKYFSFGIHFLKYKNIDLEYDFYIRIFNIKGRITNLEGHAFLDDWIGL